MEHAEVKGYIDKHKWKNAVTYQEFLPHEYLIRNWLYGEDVVEFDKVTNHIREKGFEATFGKLGANRYYVVDGYYYWCMERLPSMASLINRAKIEDYLFWEETDLLGTTLRCRRRKRNEEAQDLKEFLMLAKAYGQENI